MTNRVLLGLRSGAYGLWVSKAGVDVISASADQLLLSTDAANVQVVASGIISSPASTFDISWTDMGYYPWVLLGSERYTPSFVYTSTSLITVTRGGDNPLIAAWNVGTPPTIPAEIRYAILNIPRPT